MEMFSHEACTFSSFILFFLIPVLVASNASTIPKQADLITEARNLILQQKAECVPIAKNNIIAQSSGHGVNHLLELYDKHSKDMNGGGEQQL